MATPVLIGQISVSEYLAASYRPDCDYLDGKVLERNVGEKPPGLLQGILYTIFLANEVRWNLMPLLEQRIQTSPASFRVPDLCLIDPLDSDSILRTPPVLCIEVLSKDDTLRSMQQSIDEYLEMGVRNVWLLDPILKRAWFASPDGLHHAGSSLAIAGSDVSIDLEHVFKRPDARMAGILGDRPV